MRSLRSIHLPSYQASIDAGALTMMVNSGSVNGIPVHASHYMLETLAREEMGFEGVFISDWEDIHKLVSVHGVAKDFKDAVAMSINAGVDMYMVPNDASTYTKTLTELVDEGRVSLERIDTAVSRILALKFKLGLFEDNMVDVDSADSIISDDRQLAKQAALESITLLKNKSSVLPINSTESSVFLVGPSSDSLANQMGGWTIGWQGMDGSDAIPPGLTIREALEETLGESLSYTANYKNTEVVTDMANKADVSIVVVGEKPYAEGDGNDAELELPEAQLELIRTLAKTDTSIVLVLVAGRPLMMPADILRSIDGFVMTFLGGSEAGTALADVLSGAYNPSGKLSFSWPKHVGQIPVTYDRLKGSPYDPLYDFGYGLSYTKFRKRNLSVLASQRNAMVSVDVENTGDVAGSEVVQVYVKFPAVGVITSEQKLVGFDKVWLEPGESKTVSLDIPLDRLALIPEDILGMAEAQVMSGNYTILIDKLKKDLTIP